MNESSSWNFSGSFLLNVSVDFCIYEKSQSLIWSQQTEVILKNRDIPRLMNKAENSVTCSKENLPSKFAPTA